ncbi:MAG: RNA polymerase sigma factor [Armatimonadota bacterium]
MEVLTDAELMELVKTGDYCAFDELYNRYSEPIRRFLFQLTWDQDTAEDYLQETFLRLYRARDRYEPTGKFSTFIFQIAKNYYLSQRRKANSRSEEISLAHQNSLGRKPFENIRANERIEPEVHLMEEYRRFRMRRAITMLPEGQKMVFTLSHFEGLKYVEIAELLEIPVGTVKSRMHAAVNTLKILLREE